MNDADTLVVVDDVMDLVRTYYVDQVAAGQIVAVLADGLARGRYAVADESTLAVVVTADLQSINGDKHLRLVHHDDELPERVRGDDIEEYAAMARWADLTGRGVARVEQLDGNIGYLDLAPVLFPAAISAGAITAAMTLLAPTQALIIDVSRCLGGDPDTVTWLCSYLYDEPVELTSLDEPTRTAPKQAWTLPFVPGSRFGSSKPVYVLTSTTTFSGGEQLSYDLQASGRATIVGEQTRGGAHAREGFRVHPHLEATISVARAVNPITGSNWEGVGVTPDIKVAAAAARDRAHQLALAATTGAA